MNKDLQFELYKRMFELQEELVTRNVCEHSLNIRLPKKMNELVEAELEDMKRRIGIKLSKNDFFVIVLMVALNYTQHEEDSKRIYKRSNGSSLSNFIDEHRERLVERVKELMYQEEMEIMMKPYITFKTRTQQIRRLKERLPEDLR